MSESSVKQTEFITGLRGYAALGVFFIHANGFGLRELNPYLNRFVDFGKYGVVAFFVISAFTISKSLEAASEFDFFRYLLRRFLRVAPMYYLALIIAFFLGGNFFYSEQFNVENDFISLIWHGSFFNWIDIKYQNNLIGIEWSVPIEFFFYLVIPLFYFLFRKSNEAIIISLIISGLFSSFGYLIYRSSDFPYEAFHWSLIKYFFSFIFGIAIYLIFKSDWDYFEKYKYPNILFILFSLSYLAYIVSGFSYPDFFTTLFVGFIILACKQKSFISCLMFENRFIIFIGNISYSIYLTHMLLFHHASRYLTVFNNPFVVLFTTLMISSCTYFLIEKPFIKLGKKIAI